MRCGPIEKAGQIELLFPVPLPEPEPEPIQSQLPGVALEALATHKFSCGQARKRISISRGWTRDWSFQEITTAKLASQVGAGP